MVDLLAADPKALGGLVSSLVAEAARHTAAVAAEAAVDAEDRIVDITDEPEAAATEAEAVRRHLPHGAPPASALA